MANVITLNTLLAIYCIFTSTSVYYAKSVSAAMQVTIYHPESESLVRVTPSQVMADGIIGGQYH